MRLVHLLRQTNKTGTSVSSSPRSSTVLHEMALDDSRLRQPPVQRLESQLFPLHASTFELLSRLYSLAVDACVCDRDYLAAYASEKRTSNSFKFVPVSFIFSGE